VLAQNGYDDSFEGLSIKNNINVTDAKIPFIEATIELENLKYDLHLTCYT